jgi:hypothetical protein
MPVAEKHDYDAAVVYDEVLVSVSVEIPRNHIVRAVCFKVLWKRECGRIAAVAQCDQRLQEPCDNKQDLDWMAVTVSGQAFHSRKMRITSRRSNLARVTSRLDRQFGDLSTLFSRLLPNELLAEK